MRPTLLRSRLFALVGGLAMFCSSPVLGQSYPDHLIRLIVPWPPGGAADVVARPVAEKLAEALGQPIIVENRPGATGTIGAAFVAKKAPPDGYTLLFATSNEVTMSPVVYEVLPYDPRKDLAPITTVLRYPNVLVVGPALPVKSVGELIARAKERPGDVTFASGGSGSTNHLTMELFKSLAGIELNHIPYKGGGPALTDLIGGHIDAMFATLPSAVAQVDSGSLRALLVTSERRAPQLPEVPSAVEAGIPGLIVSTWSGVLAPPGTPPDIIAKLNAEITKVVEAPELKARLEQLAAEVYTTSPEEFSEMIRREFATWSQVAEHAGVKPD